MNMLEKKGKKFTFEIPRHLKDKRIDSALFEMLKEEYPQKKALSRAFVTNMIKRGRVRLNNVVVKASNLVSFHDVIEVEGEIFPIHQEKEKTVSTSLSKVFENEDFLVIDKPGNLEVHGKESSQAVSLVDLILFEYPELHNIGEDPRRPGIVHRLDRETSGVMVVAKNNESFHELKKNFQKRVVEKKYVTLVYGNLKELSGKVDTSLMRLSGELKRKAVDTEQATDTLSGNVRTALTYYRVLARYKDFDLVEVTPKTGRTHQIRVHLSSLGHPVVGDKLYAFKPAKRGEVYFSERQLLHAYTLKFTLFDKKYSFLTPLPEDFRRALQDIDETRLAGYDDEALKSLLVE